jgi:hypothetical protein
MAEWPGVGSGSVEWASAEGIWGSVLVRQFFGFVEVS